MAFCSDDRETSGQQSHGLEEAVSVGITVLGPVTIKHITLQL